MRTALATELQQLITEVRALPPEDKQRLRQILDEDLASPAPHTGEEEFKRRLVERGLLKEIKPPVSDLQPYQNRQPFEIEGKPLSETIIEERR